MATEAYLDTARQRISVRRHVRLMDYALHEGCNARAWVCFHTDQDVDLDPQDFYLITETREGGPGGSLVLREEDLQDIPPDRYEVFEPLYLGEGALSFCDADLKDPICLVRRLIAAGDPLTRYLLKELPQDFRKQLKGVQDWLPEEVRAGLVAALNRWIEGQICTSGRASPR